LKANLRPIVRDYVTGSSRLSGSPCGFTCVPFKLIERLRRHELTQEFIVRSIEVDVGLVAEQRIKSTVRRLNSKIRLSWQYNLLLNRIFD